MGFIKELLNEIAKEQDDLYFEEISKDYNKIFQLDKIPDEELERQYHDFAFDLMCTGFSGKFIYINEELVFDDPQATLSPEEAKNEVMTKLGLADWQIRISNGVNHVRLMILVPTISDNEETMKKAMLACGWTFAARGTLKDNNGRFWIVLNFDPKYQDDETNAAKKIRYLAHWSPMANAQSILTNGLEPRSENQYFSYEPKVHLYGKGSYFDIINLGKKLSGSNHKSNGKYSLFIVDTYKVPDDVKFYYDPRCEGAFYTKDKIPPEAVQNTMNYDFINDRPIY